MGGETLMARVATPRSRTLAVGLYRFLDTTERREFRRWEDAQDRRVMNGGSPRRYPRQRRLEAFTALSPVNVASGEIFGWGAVQAGAPQVQRPAGRLPGRAVVSPDDSVVFTDDDWTVRWLDENGL